MMTVKKIDLFKLDEEKLLALRVCDLPLKIPGTWLEDCINKLYQELDSKGLRFHPACYLSDEWLAPEHEPVIGIPFFLAHPVLIKLEHKMMLDVEGGTKQWCLKLLRHETGHTLNYAYRLYKKKKWRKIFGSFSKEYGDTYKFRPYSKSFVRHLEDYYAQYHPEEDFVETFAVWLNPDIDWRTKYKGWKALSKLEYVEELMQEIKDKKPLKKKGKRYWQLARLRITLKNYYKKKRHFYAEDFPDFHDANLKKIFLERPAGHLRLPLAGTVIRRYRKNIRDNVSAWTGEKKYVIDKLLANLLERCRFFSLVVADSEPLAVLKVSIYITTLIMNYMYTGRLRGKRA